MKFLKITSGVLLLIIVVAGIGVFIVANNINGLIKTAVEEVGSDTLDTSVSLDSVNLQLLQGRIQLSGLTVGSPAGFDQAEVFVLNDIVVEVELASLMESTIDVKEISVDGARVVVEQKGAAINLKALLDNVNSASQASDSEPEQKTASTAPDVLIKVRALNFTSGSMYLVSDRFGDRDLALPTIALTAIGGDKGVPPEQLAEKITKPLLKQLIKGMEQGLKDLYEDKAKEKLKEKEDELKQKLKSKLGEKLGDDGDGGGLKSLLSR